MNVIEVDTISPGELQFHPARQQILNQAPTLLASSYGTEYRGDGLNLFRMLDTRPWIFAAWSSRGALMGLSYVHRSGKRGATAVQPTLQKTGLGRELVRASLDRVPHQWAEVSIPHDRQLGLLMSEAFETAQSWATIEKYLGTLLAPLVVSHEDSPPYRYRRVTGMPPYVERGFTFLIHGAPDPLPRGIQPHPFHPKEDRDTTAG